MTAILSHAKLVLIVLNRRCSWKSRKSRRGEEKDEV